MNKEEWLQQAETNIRKCLTGNDGRFEGQMNAALTACDYENQSITLEFETQKWQTNARDGIHAGAIAGIFAAAFSVVANFTAGENDVTTVDLHISYIRPLDDGQHVAVTVYIVRIGRKIIRLRAEMFCKETGKIVATGVGAWMPL